MDHQEQDIKGREIKKQNKRKSELVGNRDNAGNRRKLYEDLYLR